MPMACVRFVLDIWEDYFGRPISGIFLTTMIAWRSSSCALWTTPPPGTALWSWARTSRTGDLQLFSLNFDIIAHEMGHLILYSEVGLPDLGRNRGRVFRVPRVGADLVALITALHFDSVVDSLLETTRGNLYTFNELNRFAELSPNKQIRIAGN